MELDNNYIYGQTPLEDEELEGLKIPTITTRSELDEFEQLNIEKGYLWAFNSKLNFSTFLTEEYILRLHKKMFGDVWKWAGQFRKSNKNIGCDKYLIAIELKKLIGDCNFWIKNRVFGENEISARYSHRIVKIHLFPNGNGRHSRLIADIMNERLFLNPPFTWGGKNLARAGDIRKKYIHALREADQDNYSPLLKFIRE